jgi:hypothetical protein
VRWLRVIDLSGFLVYHLENVAQAPTAPVIDETCHMCCLDHIGEGKVSGKGLVVLAGATVPA